MSPKVRSEMSKNLITINQNQDLESAHKMMFQHQIRHLVVMNDAGEICGILSERDVLRGMNSVVRDMFGTRVEELKFKPNSLVSDYMTWPVCTISADTDLATAAQTMMNQRLSSLLVENKNQIMGIITTEDLLRALVHFLKDQDPESLSIKEFFSQNFIGSVANSLNNVGI